MDDVLGRIGEQRNRGDVKILWPFQWENLGKIMGKSWENPGKIHSKMEGLMGIHL